MFSKRLCMDFSIIAQLCVLLSTFSFSAEVEKGLHNDKTRFSLDVHIDRGGNGSVIAFLETLDSKKKTSDISQSNVVNAITNDLKEYGFKAVDILRFNGVASNGWTIHARYENIFCLIRLFDSSVPFYLAKDRTFIARWDGDVLEFGVDFVTNGLAKAKVDTTWNCCQFYTEGTFLNGTTGMLSEDRKRCVNTGEERLFLRIGDLGHRIQ